MNYRDIRLFDEISWCIRDTPDKAEVMTKDDEWIPLTSDDLHRVRHMDINTPYLIVPLTRFYKVSEIIPLDKELTAQNVMQKIYDFYHTPLSEKELEKVQTFPDDSYDYLKDVLDKIANKKEVCYIDLRGDSDGFEGIEKVASNVYKLELAS